jgi:hypothetical protein
MVFLARLVECNLCGAARVEGYDRLPNVMEKIIGDWQCNGMVSIFAGSNEFRYYQKLNKTGRLSNM